jgi:hypothetical protein
VAALKNYQRYASDGVVVCCRCAHGVNIELFSCDCDYVEDSSDKV